MRWILVFLLSGFFSVTSWAGTLLVYGDSLSAAYGMAEKDGWVALLEKRLAAGNYPIKRVVNASISGETTAGGLQRFAETFELVKPSYLILELGANDALRGQNLKRTEENLAKMIEAAQQVSKNAEQGVVVYLLGIKIPPNYGAVYAAALDRMYRNLADKYKLVFDEFFLEEVALNPELMQSDGLHPNEKAQPIIEQRIFNFLALE